MTQQQQSTVDTSSLAAVEAEQENQSPFDEQQRQELEVKINELRAKCRLQAEQLMAWRKAYAFEVSQRLICWSSSSLFGTRREQIVSQWQIKCNNGSVAFLVMRQKLPKDQNLLF